VRRHRGRKSGPSSTTGHVCAGRHDATGPGRQFDGRLRHAHRKRRQHGRWRQNLLTRRRGCWRHGWRWSTEHHCLARVDHPMQRWPACSNRQSQGDGQLTRNIKFNKPRPVSLCPPHVCLGGFGGDQLPIPHAIRSRPSRGLYTCNVKVLAWRGDQSPPPTPTLYDAH